MISSSIMVVREAGFTITEMVVTLVIITIFMTLFFQLFLTGLSQQTVVTSQAAANDIALSNLSKITSRGLLPGSTACTTGAGSVNNLLPNPDGNPSAPGSIIVTNDSSEPSSKYWGTAVSGLQAEPLTNTPLPTDTIQELRVQYPFGCSSSLPVKIISTVIYDSESVGHATLVK